MFGSKSYKDKVNAQLKTNPLYLGDFQLKRKESDRYLGQILLTNGVRASCEATIKDREGKIKGATFEVQSIVEDFKMQAIGGMMTAWELWERAMIPSLLSGAGTWTLDRNHQCSSGQAGLAARLLLESNIEGARVLPKDRSAC